MARTKGTPKKHEAASEGGCCGEGCCGEASSCCGLPEAGCCQVEAVTTVDGRGQMVLPKEVRDQFGLAAGSKLAVVVWKRGSAPCCVTLHKVDELAERLRMAYGPILKEIVT